MDAKLAEYEAISSKYTKSHPDVIRVARETQEVIAKLHDYQEQKKDDPVEDTVAQDATPPEPFFATTTLNSDFTEAEIELELQRATRDLTDRTQAVKDVSTQIQQLQARLSPTPEISRDLTLLMSSQEAAKQRYSYLHGRKSNAELAASVDTNEKNETFKVIDEPNLPTIPIRPNRPMLATLAAAASLLLGLGMAFFRNTSTPL